MKYLTAIPVYGRIYNFGIRENKFLLSNIQDREDREWNTLPCDVRTLEDYPPLVQNAKNRLFLVSDDSGANKWVAVQTRNSCLLVDAPWRDVMQWLRVNIVDLGDGVYYVRNMALSYYMGLGNFYLYPELNPLKLPLIRQAGTFTIDEIINSVSEVFNIDEIKDHLPIGKMGRFVRGLVVSGPHLWWVDKRSKLAHYLNEHFFEGAISFKKYLEMDDSDTGLFKLPRESNGSWESPVINPAMISGLIMGEGVEIIPATGTRISTNTKADKNSSGDYTIPGYGRFGRVDLSDRLVAFIRGKLGSCLSLDIRGERFIALYNISDIKAIYIRENPVWVEPVIKQPMVELAAEIAETVEVNETVEDIATTQPDAPYSGNFVAGWQSPETLEIKPTTYSEIVPQVEQLDLEIQQSTEDLVSDVTVEPVEEVKEVQVEQTVVDVAVQNSGEEFMNLLDEKEPFKTKVVNSFMELALNGQPIICHGYIENHEDIEVSRMLKGEIILIDLGGVYGNLIPWRAAEQPHYNHAMGIVNGEYFSSADASIIYLNDSLYITDMHINL